MTDGIDGGEANSSRSRFGGTRVFLRGRAREWLGQERRAERRQARSSGRRWEGPDEVVGWQEGWRPCGLSWWGLPPLRDAPFPSRGAPAH